MQLFWNEALQITEFKSDHYQNQQTSSSSEHSRQALFNVINTRRARE